MFSGSEKPWACCRFDRIHMKSVVVTYRDGRFWKNNMARTWILGWWVEASHFTVVAPWEILQVAHTIPNWPIERLGSTLKECKEMVDSCLGAGSMYCLEGCQFNPITDFMVGGWVESSHLIVAALREILQLNTLFQTGSLKGQGLALGGMALEAKGRNAMVDACRCWQHASLGKLEAQPDHQYHGGLMGWGQPFDSGCI